MTYRVYYTSADGPTDDGPWSLYSEEYESDTADEPIEGSGRHIASYPTEAEADIRCRLENLRVQIDAEQISWHELYELQLLAEFIEPGDVQLLEWAGVPEFEESL